jgi:hypothetical protein
MPVSMSASRSTARCPPDGFASFGPQLQSEALLRLSKKIAGRPSKAAATTRGQCLARKSHCVFVTCFGSTLKMTRTSPGWAYGYLSFPRYLLARASM